jgi:hypothetical protein
MTIRINPPCVQAVLDKSAAVSRDASRQPAGKKTATAFMMNDSRKQLSLIAAGKEGQRAQEHNQVIC